MARTPSVLIFALVLAGLACNRIDVRPGPSSASGPNVLLITIDTFRADRLGALGGPHAAPTPTLDRLAAEGALFTRAMAPTPITLPSHAAILTGRTPARTGVRHNGLHRLGEDMPTLAERFAEAGHATGAVVAAVVLAEQYGLGRGFDHYDDDIGPHRAALTGYHERPAREVTDAALGWLGERDPGRPFFLWVHYYDPHAAYDPPSPWRERLPQDPYAGEIAYVDAQVGRLVESLRVGGRLEDTVVAVTADHGESLGEHDESTHAYTIYDAAVHVPMLVRGPGVEAGSRIEQVSSTIDLAPTLLSLAGLPGLDDADGRDLAAELGGGPATPPAPAYSETLATQLDHGWAPLHALRDETHRYIRAPRPELYDLTRDPRERDNLLRAPDDMHREREAAFERELTQILSQQAAGTEVELDAATRAQLQALGYALPDAPAAQSDLDPKDGLRMIRPFELAKARYQEGAIEEAEARMLELGGDFPESPAVHDLLARIYLSQSRAAEALVRAERALELAPASAQQHHLVGLAHLSHGDPVAAVAAFEAALAIDPGHWNSRAGLLWRLRTGGSLEDALEAERIALESQPMNAELRVLIADTWDQLGHYDRALERYQEAVALDASHGPAHLGLAVSIARLGPLNEVEAHMARSGVAGQALGSRMRLALALAGRGELVRAEGIVRSVVGEAPGFAPARRVWAKLLDDLGRPAEAQAVRAGGAQAAS